jgi:hypothetical protein
MLFWQMRLPAPLVKTGILFFRNGAFSAKNGTGLSPDFFVML